MLDWNEAFRERTGRGRWLRKIAFSVCVLVILLALAGASYPAIESRLNARHFPENGRLVDVGGYRLIVGIGKASLVLQEENNTNLK